MNQKELDYTKNSKGENPNDRKKSQNKKDVVMVNVGMKKAMKPEHWSKKPGQKAIFISSLAGQPSRKGSVRSKTVKGYNTKPMLRCSKTGKCMCTQDRNNQHQCKIPHKNKHYKPAKHSWDNNKPMKRGNAMNLQWINGTTLIWGKPTMPYKFHIQYVRTKNFVKQPSNRLSWA